MPVSAVNNSSGAAAATGKASQAMDSADFMKIMITELQNQDPFEPMTNKELVGQMSAIQQVESTQKMNKLLDGLDTMLQREDLSAAGKMIGQVVSGKNADGDPVYGKVIAINITDKEVSLELDTGDTVKMDDVTRMGGQRSEDIIGQLVQAQDTASGKLIVGTVESLDVNGSQIMLNVTTRDAKGNLVTTKVPMEKANLLNRDNVFTLVGHGVSGITDVDGTPTQVGGIVKSYRLEGKDNDGKDQIILSLEDNGKAAELPLENLTEIKITSN